MTDHRTYTPPTYLPVHKPKVADDAVVIMNPALREWLILRGEVGANPAGGPADLSRSSASQPKALIGARGAA